MWLIETSSLTLKFFNNPTDVAYAILSHTWGEGEVTFQDIADAATAPKKNGWAKIKQTCQIALETHKLSYVWIDTCCIDKSSSSELSEAINSMFSWYKTAAICMVYLDDCHLESLQEDDENEGLLDGLFSCRWFTRGWTLQELIAPRDVLFYSASWVPIGSKRKSVSILSRITGIDAAVLKDITALEACHTAKRMSWASRRQTTRTEDIAYCLLGIFDINMPLLYGEGEKAFLRLQQELARSKNDLTLFAWRQANSDLAWYRGLFARSPSEFQHSAGLRVPPNSTLQDTEFSATNRGLRFDNHICLDELYMHGAPRCEADALILSLDCLEPKGTTSGTARWIAIYLRKNGPNYLRFDPWSFCFKPSRSPWRSPSSLVIYVSPTLSTAQANTLGSGAHVSSPLLSRLQGVICCHEDLRRFIYPPDSLRNSSDANRHGVANSIVLGTPEISIADQYSFNGAPAMRQFVFNLNFAPSTSEPGKTHPVILLTGCTAHISVSHQAETRQKLFWHALLSVDDLVDHWIRVSMVPKKATDVDVSNPEFQDYMFERFSDETGTMDMRLLPRVFSVVDALGQRHQISARISWTDGYQDDLLMTPPLVLEYARISQRKAGFR
ncbi:heterokaryon incompatibility protein-domain-containing protein [Podospora aff. communis PSN243]|uniref:Heterokaryon incompatibility protein-domain-containing protein n=1 Tax=Podospora aff. communis PSN243 TaxID=3040156 RepID=A0AAV9GUG5_9PEZI|nr:heterokaryon incompatibility protein-domain-containing protein [Podospora aff. communis PSN243]